MIACLHSNCGVSSIVLCWFIRVVFQVCKPIGAMVAKHGIDFVSDMISLVFFSFVMKLW